MKPKGRKRIQITIMLQNKKYILGKEEKISEETDSSDEKQEEKE